jgi:hypothetical protein
MKKFFTLILCLLIAGSVYANCALTIEEITVEPNQESVTVPINAHFEHWVSAVQVDLELPDGLSVQRYENCTDLMMSSTNIAGYPADYMPTVAVNNSKTRFIALSMESDYYNGKNVGVVKWCPSDYVFWEITLKVADNFKGGVIKVMSVVCSGADERPWVTPCGGCYTTTEANVGVEGVTPDEPEPIDDHDVGYWLVIVSGANKNYIKMENNYTHVRLVGSDGETSVSYHFRINGIDYGAPREGRETDMEDLMKNPLFPISNNYSIEGGRQYLLAVMGYPGEEQCYLHAHVAYGGGTDDVPEAVTDRQVKNIRYYNINGQEMGEPHGFTIIVTTYTDGTTKTEKMLK